MTDDTPVHHHERNMFRFSCHACDLLIAAHHGADIFYGKDSIPRWTDTGRPVEEDDFPYIDEEDQT